jgi:hypothetical protein
VRLRAAIITVKRITLAVVQVDEESTYPATGQAMLRQAELIFRALPIVLLGPRIGGFSRSYATFDLTHIVPELNADEIVWQHYTLRQSDEPAPF